MTSQTYKRTILITGASRGIGAALARQFAHPNHHLILVARSRIQLERVATSCQQRGATVMVHVADISQPEFSNWLAQIDQQHPINLVIASAGISSARDNTQPENLMLIRKMVHTNIIGTLNTIEPLIDGMRKRRCGQIALMGSLASIIPMPQFPSYTLAKTGILGYSQALRSWLQPYGISVSIICPGFVDTDMSQQLTGPKPGLLSTQHAAQVIEKGLQKKRRLIAFPKALYWLAAISKYCPIIRNKILARIHYRFTDNSCDSHEQD